MKRRGGLIVCIVIAVGVLIGCATPGSKYTSGPKYVWKIQPTSQRAENEHFVAEITPNLAPNMFFGEGTQYFTFSLQNKTEKNIEIDWNRTLYIKNGQTSGGFMYEGVVYRDRNNQKTPDIVFPKQTIVKKIFPNTLVSFARRWYHNNMPEGENGIYLSVVIDGKVYNEKLTVNLTKTAAESTN